MSDAPRVALLTDSFHEVNGAARALRELAAYARRRQYPFLVIRNGDNPGFSEEGPIQTLELKHSPLAFPIDPDLYFDTLFYRYREIVQETVRRFEPDLVHIIGPGSVGILGAIAAAVVKVPLVLSWHTNLHEFASRRVANMLGWVPGSTRLEDTVERFVLDRVVWYFGRGDVLLAPSPELMELLQSRTGKPTFFMGRGVDSDQFSPGMRDRTDEVFTVGFVGRLMPEKNVRFLADIARRLDDAGADFRIVIVGSGPERDWLATNVKNCRLAGVLHGNALGRAYANFDVFAFPSRTDTFGQVVQEAQSSGVPAVVTNQGGPQMLVEHQRTGFVTATDEEFLGAIVHLSADPELRRRMGEEGRRVCLDKSWDRIGDEIYRAYDYCRLHCSRHRSQSNGTTVAA